MDTPMVLEWVIGIGLVAIVLIWIVVMYNKIIRLENAIDNAAGQIDVQLQRRADLIPNLVNTVKGYAAHEKSVLENVTAARAALVNANGIVEQNAADNMLTQALGRLFAVAEAYPDLKANQNFLQLQDELTHTENKVSFARQYYNDSVLRFNNAIETFPGNVFASFMSKKERPMLEIPPTARDLPKVSFT